MRRLAPAERLGASHGRRSHETILIATDGSPSAAEAVDFGIELAADQHASATLVEVVPVVDVVPSAASG